MYVDAAHRNALTSRATVVEVEEEMMTWLRGAPDRHEGRACRAKKKARYRQTLSGIVGSSWQSRRSPNAGSGRSRSNSQQCHVNGRQESVSPSASPATRQSQSRSVQSRSRSPEA